MFPDQGVVNPLIKLLSTHPTITNVITDDKLTSYLHPHLTLSWVLIGQMYKHLPLIGQGYILLTRADLYITVQPIRALCIMTLWIMFVSGLIVTNVT